MKNSILKTAKTLLFTLTIPGASFGQLNNCVNTKEHPLIKEIIDSVMANPNYKSMLAYTIIRGDRIGLATSTVLNLAYGWAASKKIKDSVLRREEELKYLDVNLSDEEFESLIFSFNEISSSNQMNICKKKIR